jgi:AraC-like DNA-binding protein
MPATLGGTVAEALERSCGPRRPWIRLGAETGGLQRIEACFPAGGYRPHRHDTYGIGITTAGVQEFRYRGERRICLPGQLHVLHPDELHDGSAATGAGFRYRIVYLDPGLVRAALGDRGALPFVPDPVQDPAPVSRRLAGLLADIDEPLSELALVAVVADLADTLVRLSGRSEPAPGPIDLAAVAAARGYLDAHAREKTTAAILERITGIDRYRLARQFRRAYGTSPDRYRTLRRLDLARTAIRSGTPLARAAAEAGFADQSHLTRQFTRAYGLTPAQWARAVGARPIR